MNLENLKIYKASFKSIIGTIYYLWVELDRDKGAGNEAESQVKLSCLINNKDLFKKYHNNHSIRREAHVHACAYFSIDLRNQNRVWLI